MEYYGSPMTDSDIHPPTHSQFDDTSVGGRARATGLTAAAGDSHFQDQEHEFEYGYGDKGGLSSKTNTPKRSGTNRSTDKEGGVSSIVRGYGTPHQIAYLSVVLVQTLATAAMIAVVWAKIREGTPREYPSVVLSAQEDFDFARVMLTYFENVIVRYPHSGLQWISILLLRKRRRSLLKKTYNNSLSSNLPLRISFRNHHSY